MFSLTLSDDRLSLWSSCKKKKKIFFFFLCATQQKKHPSDFIQTTKKINKNSKFKIPQIEKKRKEKSLVCVCVCCCVDDVFDFFFLWEFYYLRRLLGCHVIYQLTIQPECEPRNENVQIHDSSNDSETKKSSNRQNRAKKSRTDWTGNLERKKDLSPPPSPSPVF